MPGASTRPPRNGTGRTPARTGTASGTTRAARTAARTATTPATETVPGPFPERMRAVIGRLGRQLRLTHPDGDLSPSQREVLGTVARRGPLRLSELAGLEGLNPTMLSRIVTKLIDRGLVVRTADPADGRAANLGLTPAGRRLQERIRDERTDALRVAFDSLDDADRALLEQALPVLERMVEVMRAAGP